uniref:Uncharacterized protein n=1 Tax=Panstrongylus lignarius TaxID=156445 RepID=A0A224XMI0_9HEMI
MSSPTILNWKSNRSLLFLLWLWLWWLLLLLPMLSITDNITTIRCPAAAGSTSEQRGHIASTARAVLFCMIGRHYGTGGRCGHRRRRWAGPFFYANDRCGSTSSYWFNTTGSLQCCHNTPPITTLIFLFLFKILASFSTTTVNNYFARRTCQRYSRFDTSTEEL